MAEARRMGKTELFTHVAVRRVRASWGRRVRASWGAKLVVQQRERRMGRHPATGAPVEIPAKQVGKARIAKQLRDVLEA